MGLEVFEAQRLAKLDGEDLTLGARAFDVLAFLFAHSDRVVSKAEILNHVWADLIVEEGNLSVQIAGLRKALGKERIKTVPGIGYRLICAEAPVTATPPPPDRQPDVPSIPSLAVLPFANLTGSADQDYLVDGIVTEVISALSRMSGIFVISSTSTFTYKGRSVDLSEVGQELGVRYVLEGSIQASGNRIRIFTQLVEAESGHTIWQERCDGTIENIFDLQDEVAECVAGALEPKLQYAEAARARAKPTDNLAAYDLCLQATPILAKLHTSERITEGLALLDQALALDPEYIQAHALYCYAHTSAFATRWWTFEKAGAAEPHARRVLESDTDDALALAYGGHFIAYLKQSYQEGLTALKRAVHLNPNSGTAQMLLGWVYTYIDDGPPAIVHLERAKRLSPLHPHIGVINSGIGSAHLQMGDTEAAIRHLEQAMTEYPDFATNQLMLIGCYWTIGRKADAMRMAAHLRRKVPDMTVGTFLRTRPHSGDRYNAMMVEALRGTGFPD